MRQSCLRCGHSHGGICPEREAPGNRGKDSRAVFSGDHAPARGPLIAPATRRDYSLAGDRQGQRPNRPAVATSALDRPFSAGRALQILRPARYDPPARVCCLVIGCSLARDRAHSRALAGEGADAPLPAVAGLFVGARSCAGRVAAGLDNF
jgi:hypothetical protein